MFKVVFFSSFVAACGKNLIRGSSTSDDTVITISDNFCLELLKTFETEVDGKFDEAQQEMVGPGIDGGKLAGKLNNCPTCCVEPRKDLLRQCEKKITDWNEKLGSVCPNLVEKNPDEFKKTPTVTSIDAMKKSQVKGTQGEKETDDDEEKKSSEAEEEDEENDDKEEPEKDADGKLKPTSSFSAFPEAPSAGAENLLRRKQIATGCLPGKDCGEQASMQPTEVTNAKFATNYRNDADDSVSEDVDTAESESPSEPDAANEPGADESNDTDDTNKAEVSDANETEETKTEGAESF